MFKVDQSCYIRDFTIPDINEQYLSWLNDKNHMKYSNQRHKNHSTKSTKEYLQTFVQNDNRFCGIFDNSDILLGTLTVYIDSFNKNANMGILISPENQGKGLGTKVFEQMLKELPQLYDLHKISAGTCELNKGMLKIFEKVGMHLDYIIHEEFYFEDKFFDNYVYAKYF